MRERANVRGLQDEIRNIRLNITTALVSGNAYVFPLRANFTESRLFTMLFEH
jgi:hypothetical protein